MLVFQNMQVRIHQEYIKVTERNKGIVYVLWCDETILKYIRTKL